MYELRKPEQMLLPDGILLTVRGKDGEEERRCRDTLTQIKDLLN